MRLFIRIMETLFGITEIFLEKKKKLLGVLISFLVILKCISRKKNENTSRNIGQYFRKKFTGNNDFAFTGKKFHQKYIFVFHILQI